MAETIRSIATLLWPILALGLFLLFRKPLSEVLRSAKHREWTLEVGGQKLSMKQLNDQQNFMIKDLQTQMGVLHQQITEPRGVPPETALQELAKATLEHDKGTVSETVPNSVLWVDDRPANNALVVEQLQANGVRVDLARSTEEGVARLGQGHYGAILSDMSRHEDGGTVRDAGIRLLREVQQTDSTIPFLIYCGNKAASVHGDEALAAGASMVTSSPAVLTQKLQSLGLL